MWKNMCMCEKIWSKKGDENYEEKRKGEKKVEIINERELKVRKYIQKKSENEIWKNIYKKD